MWRLLKQIEEEMESVWFQPVKLDEEEVLQEQDL